MACLPPPPPTIHRKAGRMMEAPCSRGKKRKKRLIVRGRFYCTHPSSRLSARPPSPGRDLHSLPPRRQPAARRGTFEGQKLARLTSEPMGLSQQLTPHVDAGVDLRQDRAGAALLF